jgi:hypothetical protein
MQGDDLCPSVGSDIGVQQLSDARQALAEFGVDGGESITDNSPKNQTGMLWAGCQRMVRCRLEGDLPTSGVVFSSFGATSFLPFPTIFRRRRKAKFSIPIGKIQNPEKQALLPLVFQRVKFHHKNWKKEEQPCPESPLPHHLSRKVISNSRNTSPPSVLSLFGSIEILRLPALIPVNYEITIHHGAYRNAAGVVDLRFIFNNFWGCAWASCICIR